jgi:hypothetical protein
MSTVADTAGVEIEEEPAAPDVTNSDLVERLVAQARADGVQLAGEGGLLRQLTKRVLESALEGEITDHLGYANPIRTRVAGVLREGPAVPARQVARQPPHVLLGLPQRLHPGEVRADPAHQLEQLLLSTLGLYHARSGHPVIFGCRHNT